MVGTCIKDMTDTSRQETLGPGTGPRRVMVRFYYPAAEGGSPARADILTDVMKKDFGRKPDYTLYNRRIVLYDRPPVRDGVFPLVLFSHGYGSSAGANSDLCQALAEKGFIVASVGHPYEASEIVYEDGTGVRYDRSITWKMFRPFLPAMINQFSILRAEEDPEKAFALFDSYQRKYAAFMSERVKEWAEDDRHALRVIRGMASAEGSFLYGKIDFSGGVAVSGHSFGGAAAYYHCLFDDEVTCGVNMDGALFGDFGGAVNHKPFLQMLNPRNATVVSRAGLYHDRPVHYMVFRDMAHLGFTDAKLVTTRKLLVGAADPALVMDTINEAHCAFFERCLVNKDTENRELLPVRRDALSRYEVR